MVEVPHAWMRNCLAGMEEFPLPAGPNSRAACGASRRSMSNAKGNRRGRTPTGVGVVVAAVVALAPRTMLRGNGKRVGCNAQRVDRRREHGPGREVGH